MEKMNKLDHQKLEHWKEKYPKSFKETKILELGSLNINGSVREHFEDCEFIGIDWREGKDVDIVCFAHETSFDKKYFDIIISFSMLEHDVHWRESLTHNLPYLKRGGLIMLNWIGKVGRSHHLECSSDGKFHPRDLKEVKEFIMELNLEILDVAEEYGGCGQQFKLLARNIIKDHINKGKSE